MGPGGEIPPDFLYLFESSRKFMESAPKSDARHDIHFTEPRKHAGVKKASDR